MARIREAHPDLDDIVQSGDWADWLEAQDAIIQSCIESGPSNDAHAALYKFKRDLRFG